jgi:hypothetical protein
LRINKEVRKEMCSTKGEDKGSDHNLQLSLSDKTKQKGIVEDITINTKTKCVKVALNHGCKQTIVCPIYQDWIKTTNTIENNDKQAGSEDITTTSNPPEKRSVTDVTNITDPNDAKAPDNRGQQVLAVRILKIVLII